MIELVTETAAVTNSIGSHRHPVLEEGNESYPDGRYVLGVEAREDGRSFCLVHRIEGAGLVSRLAKEGKVQYGCIVSSPKSFYRETHVSQESRQTIEWEPGDLGEPPLFTPVILCAALEEVTLSAQEHGVHSVWEGVRVRLSPGSRLAVGTVFDLRSSLLQMISIELGEDLSDGSFFVEARTEPFSFAVKASRNLHQFIRQAKSHSVRQNILTHVVTACLALLQRDFDKREAWDRNLEKLAELVGDKTDGLTWDDDDFVPEAAATALYPLVVPKEGW